MSDEERCALLYLCAVLYYQSNAHHIANVRRDEHLMHESRKSIRLCACDRTCRIQRGHIKIYSTKTNFKGQQKGVQARGK